MNCLNSLNTATPPPPVPRSPIVTSAPPGATTRFLGGPPGAAPERATGFVGFKPPGIHPVTTASRSPVCGSHSTLANLSVQVAVVASGIPIATKRNVPSAKSPDIKANNNCGDTSLHVLPMRSWTFSGSWTLGQDAVVAPIGKHAWQCLANHPWESVPMVHSHCQRDAGVIARLFSFSHDSSVGKRA